jgi:uncharacterized membrane protein
VLKPWSPTIMMIVLLLSMLVLITVNAVGTEAGGDPDVELMFDPYVEPTDWIRPSHQWSYPVLLRNLDNVVNDFQMTLNVSREHFEARVEPSRVEDVYPDQTVVLNVTVIAPENVEDGTYLSLNLTATSLEKGYARSLEWYLYVKAVKAVAIEPERDFVYIEPTDHQVTLNITLNNVGDRDVDLHVQAYTFLGIEEVEIGVTVTFNVTDLQIESKGSCNISMRIWVYDGPPVSAAMAYQTRIQAVDMDEKTTSWYGVVRWAVKARFHIAVDPPFNSIMWTVQGQCSTFQMYFTQDTNDLRGHLWTVEFPKPKEGWTIVHPIISMYNLTGKDGIPIEYVVRPSDSVPAGERYDMVITFVCENDPQLDFKVTYVFLVSEYHDVVITVNPRQVHCSPGATVYINVSVENQGNVPEPAVIHVRLLNESYSRFELNETRDLLDDPLHPGITRRFKVPIHTTPLTTPGNNNITVSISWNGRTDWANVTLVVDERIELVGQASTSGPIVVNPNMDPFLFVYHLWNRGNGALFIIVDVHVRPVDSGVMVTPDLVDPDRTVMILPGNRLDLGFWVKNDGRREFDFDVDGGITLAFFTRDGTTLFQDTLDLTLVGPDLTIRDATVATEVDDDGLVMLHVWISNVGSGSSVPSTVTVVGAKDQTAVHRVYVPSIGPGEETMVQMLFIAYTGTNKYQLVLDPEDVLIEDGGSANDRIVSIDGGGDDVGDDGPSSNLLPISLMVLMVAGALIAWVLWSHRGRRG